jgi:hypothetical protein
MSSGTSYHRLGSLLQEKVQSTAKGVTFLESRTISGHTFELWATIETNEIDSRFFVVAPGMQVLHIYLSDFQELLRLRDKVVTDAIEGTVFGQASYTFRLLVARMEDQFRDDLDADDQDTDALVHWPVKALVQAVHDLGRTYRHVLLINGQLVTGEVIKTR